MRKSGGKICANFLFSSTGSPSSEPAAAESHQCFLSECRSARTCELTFIFTCNKKKMIWKYVFKSIQCKRLISADTGPGGPNTHRLVLILTQPRERKHRVYLLMWNSGQFDPTKARWAGRETLELDQEAGLKRTNPNSPFTSWSWAAGRIKAGRWGLNVSHIHPPGLTGWREEVSEGSGSFLSCSLWLVSLTDTNANVSAVNWRKSFVRANIVNESWRVTSVRRTCGLREAGDRPTSTLLWFRRLV